MVQYPHTVQLFSLTHLYCRAECCCPGYCLKLLCTFLSLTTSLAFDWKPAREIWSAIKKERSPWRSPQLSGQLHGGKRGSGPNPWSDGRKCGRFVPGLGRTLLCSRSLSRVPFRLDALARDIPTRPRAGGARMYPEGRDAGRLGPGTDHHSGVTGASGERTTEGSGHGPQWLLAPQQPQQALGERGARSGKEPAASSPAQIRAQAPHRPAWTQPWKAGVPAT